MMNKLSKLLIALLITFSANVFSQTKEDALKDANITSKATLEMDFETVLKHTIPTVVDIMGGKEAAITLLTNTFDGMKSQGFEFEKANVIDVSDIVKEQEQYRCVIEGFNQMKMAGQRIKSKSYLLGVYNETDGYWWFIEAKQLKNKALLDQVIPNFETSLVIPDDDVSVEPIEE